MGALCMRMRAPQGSPPSSTLSAHVHASHNGKADKADLLYNAKAKVIAKGLADLDTVADAKLRDLTWLNCIAGQVTVSIDIGPFRLGQSPNAWHT